MDCDRPWHYRAPRNDWWPRFSLLRLLLLDDLDPLERLVHQPQYGLQGIATTIEMGRDCGHGSGDRLLLPMLFNPPAIQPAVHSNGRLLYDIASLHSIFHNFVNTEPVGELVYWGFIVLPLIAVSDKAVKLFGVLIFVSIFLTWATYSATFNSVWCFYCAVLSIIVIWIVNRPHLRRA